MDERATSSHLKEEREIVTFERERERELNRERDSRRRVITRKDGQLVSEDGLNRMSIFSRDADRAAIPIWFG